MVNHFSTKIGAKWVHTKRILPQVGNLWENGDLFEFRFPKRFNDAEIGSGMIAVVSIVENLLAIFAANGESGGLIAVVIYKTDEIFKTGSMPEIMIPAPARLCLKAVQNARNILRIRDIQTFPITEDVYFCDFFPLHAGKVKYITLQGIPREVQNQRHCRKEQENGDQNTNSFLTAHNSTPFESEKDSR